MKDGSFGPLSCFSFNTNIKRRKEKRGRERAALQKCPSPGGCENPSAFFKQDTTFRFFPQCRPVRAVAAESTFFHQNSSSQRSEPRHSGKYLAFGKFKHCPFFLELPGKELQGSGNRRAVGKSSRLFAKRRRLWAGRKPHTGPPSPKYGFLRWTSARDFEPG